MKYTANRAIFTDRYIVDASNLIIPYSGGNEDMRNAWSLLDDTQEILEEYDIDQEISAEDEKAVIDTLRKAAALVEPYYEEDPQEQNAAGTICAAINEFEENEVETQDVTLKVKVSSHHYLYMLDVIDDDFGINDLVEAAIEDYLQAYYKRQKDMIRSAQEGRIKDGEIEVTTYTINEGEPSQYWGLKEKATNAVLIGAPNNWKTKNGAVRWAEKNGLKVVE